MDDVLMVFGWFVIGFLSYPLLNSFLARLVSWRKR